MPRFLRAIKKIRFPRNERRGKKAWQANEQFTLSDPPERLGPSLLADSLEVVKRCVALHQNVPLIAY